MQYVYFYCNYNDPAKRTLKGVARSLIAQILALNPVCLPFLYDKALSSGEPILTSTKLCTQYLTRLAKSHDQLVIGIDGLDECEEQEKGPILAMVDSIVSTTKATRNVRFFITSRKERVIEKSLRFVITLQIRPHHLERDIECYVRVRTSQLGEIFSVNVERQKWIITEVTQRAHGT